MSRAEVAGWVGVAVSLVPAALALLLIAVVR